jgi:hypothetical protein
MTVIASYNHFGCGLVLGDILTNGPVGEGNIPQTNLPTLGNVINFFEGNWAICKPAQKVCIITDYCALAWAGSQVHASLFVERLVKLSKRIRINESIIECLLNKCGENKVSIVGSIHEDGSLKTFGYGSEKFICPILGNVYAAGSGSSIIKDYLNIIENMMLEAPHEDEIAVRGVSLILTQVAHLLNAEFRKGDTADSIREFFGGGYEIAAFYDGKFQKITSNFVFFDIVFEDGYLEIENPLLLISQTYSDRNLRFEAVSLRARYDDEVVRHDIIEIPSFHGSACNDFSAWTGSNISWVCFVFVDDFKFFGKELISIILKSDTPPINYSVIEGRLEVSYSPKTQLEIQKSLMSIYG